ncbi:SDR family oxidoreductase [Aldersonia sp. NBC_00410]|uniref:SDR family NAD(P)-dependent oxidoreductase n=1 Tax=Aldersonia sp. NBC_00410 TaxID=2975954 RepID=UPI00224E4CA8|nr:SDR family oxidoreductase [Aldersonia sp. NBC_00410]MCX5042011.1 SDR family oxidoreductase [Aldersonia sp. NBC_00410]
MASRSLRPVALVTGPTSGLGAGFAERLARRGYDLVLVARDKQRLADLAADLEQQFDARSEIIAADLGTDEGRAAAVERLHQGVDFLVNNAGFGLSGEFWTAAPAALQAQLDVNVTAVTQLTRAALPSMLGNAKGSIVNVASVAGLVPGRGSTYSGTKSYVVAFTEGLSNGLVGTGVQIQALCPGFIHTEFHERAGIPMESIPEFMWLSVDQVVTASFEDLEKGKVISIPGWQYKVITSASRLVPRGLARRVTKLVGRGRGRT